MWSEKGWESVPYRQRTLATSGEVLSFRVKNIVAKTNLEKKKRVFCENEKKKNTRSESLEMDSV
jgi:hypothetical protein